MEFEMSSGKRILGVIPEHILRKMSFKDRRELGVSGLTFTEAEERRVARDERELQDQMAANFRRYEIVANRSRMDKAKTDMVGWPDFTFAVRGQACAFEVKLPGEHPTDDQKICMDRLSANGWLVGIWYSVNDQLRTLRELRAIS